MTFLINGNATLQLNDGIVTDGLVLLYDPANPVSYPGSGSRIRDLSSTGNDGTITSFTYSDGTLVGAGSGNIQAPDNSAYDGSAWTVSLCCKFTGTLNYQGLVNKEDTSLNTGFEWDLGGGNYFMYFQTNDASPSGDPYFYGSNYDDGLWHNWVGRLENKILTVTKDNVTWGTKTEDDDPLNSVAPLTFFESWTGSIGHITFYNRKLTDDEVTKNYNFLKRRYGF